MASGSPPERPVGPKEEEDGQAPDEQIAYALRQAASGTVVADVCRQMGISEATSYVWKKKYAYLRATELRELRQLREENAVGC